MSECKSLWLDKQLCFALYTATNAITRSYRTPLEELGLTYPQYLVILSLLEKPSMTSGELARALKLDAGTLTPMLKRLAVSGLIARTRRVDDERVIDNRLTERGQALQQDLLKTQNEVVCKAGLPDSEVTACATSCMNWQIVYPITPKPFWSRLNRVSRLPNRDHNRFVHETIVCSSLLMVCRAQSGHG